VVVSPCTVSYTCVSRRWSMIMNKDELGRVPSGPAHGSGPREFDHIIPPA
jgi:hypothetical protein